MPNPPIEYQLIEKHISNFMERTHMGKYAGFAKNEPLHIQIPVRKIQNIHVYTELVITDAKEENKLVVEFLIYTLYVYQLKATKKLCHRTTEAVTEEDKDYYLLYTFRRGFDVSQLAAAPPISENGSLPPITSFARDFVSDLFEELKCLRFSKCYNVFVRSEDYLDDYFNSMNDALAVIMENKYECMFQNCCVCLEMTNHATFCGHHVCIPCLDKLTDFRCPMCRICLHCNTNSCEKIGEDV